MNEQEKTIPSGEAAAAPKAKKRRGLYIAAAAALLCAAAALLLWRPWSAPAAEGADAYESYIFDTSAIEGRIQTMTEEEIQAELNRVVEEGMFNISIAASIIFDPETGEGQARIENVAANRYHMQVDITLDDTGETVYSSALIRPGYSIEYITLNTDLAPGVYNATATFSAITQEELQLFGQAAAQLQLYIPNPDGSFPVA